MIKAAGGTFRLSRLLRSLRQPSGAALSLYHADVPTSGENLFHDPSATTRIIPHYHSFLMGVICMNSCDLGGPGSNLVG